MRDRPLEKIIDMTRSVLPSKARKGTRIDRSKIHRADRRNAKMSLEWMEDLAPEDFESEEGFYYFWEEPLDADRETRQEIKQMVQDRRRADKLGGFLRWAKKNTKHIESEEDKYYHIKEKIGSSVIKDHALGHFISLERARNPFWLKSILDYPIKRDYYKRTTPWKTFEQLTAWIREAINLDHKGLNRFLKNDGYLTRKCKDTPEFRCWVEMASEGLYKVHNEKFCQAKSLLNCLEIKRNSLPETEFVCWASPSSRIHDSQKCVHSRHYVRDLNDVEEVANFYWGDYPTWTIYGEPLTPNPNNLENFLRMKGIIS